MHIGISSVLALATIVTGFVAAQAQVEARNPLAEGGLLDMAPLDIYPEAAARPPHIYTPQDPPPDELNLTKRANIRYIGHNNGQGKGVFVCEHKKWQGDCWHISLRPGTCWNLWREADNKISSAGPDKGYMCYFFDKVDCKGEYRAFRQPGFDDLKGIGWNDLITSIKCVVSSN